MSNRKNDIRLLAIDVGNTNVHFALFSGKTVQKTFRIKTPELNSRAIRQVARKIPLKSVEAAVIASVVPSAGNFLKENLPKELNLKTYLIGKDLKAPVVNKYKKPGQVGIDRLVNAVAAFHRYPRSLILVDFGTAITLDVVSQKGEYLGGIIAPGIEISLEALFHKTALLPKIRLKHPGNIIGKDTVESIRVGCSVGIGGLCDRLIQRVKTRFRPKPLVIATGGYALFMKRYCQCIDLIDPFLTLKGIQISFAKSFAKKFLTK